jgi:hypothetical protein
MPAGHTRSTPQRQTRKIPHPYDEVFFLVISPGRTWKQFWESMERMSDRLEEFGIDG